MTLDSACKYCPYNRPSYDGLHEDCYPPLDEAPGMGQCRLELETAEADYDVQHYDWADILS